MRITMAVKNADALAAIAEKCPAIAEKHVSLAINRALVRIWGEEKREAPFGVTGQLRDRWILTQQRFAGKLTSGVHYALAVHEGTKPHFVSPDELAPWARKKGLNPYAVSKSIQKKGTRANPFLQRAVDNSAKGVEKEFATAIENTLKELTA